MHLSHLPCPHLCRVSCRRVCEYMVNMNVRMFIGMYIFLVLLSSSAVSGKLSSGEYTVKNEFVPGYLNVCFLICLVFIYVGYGIVVLVLISIFGQTVRCTLPSACIPSSSASSSSVSGKLSSVSGKLSSAKLSSVVNTGL